ncbi:putative GEM-like protein 8 [Dendrobium catenatum]|uniref:putative GEM-like protein 8 n=1 Tax=Dendrobium catenatum TaxID=906689 RepID=UPI0010A0B7AE|nr:putative GEM-like protein 8 [Dendrobium catenatum]
MKNQSQGSVIGYPVILEPIVAYSRPAEYGTAHLKQKRLESIIDLMNKFRRKADNLAQGIGDHGEKLIQAFQCHLSTTAGPIPGLLFISTEKIAFISDRSLLVRSPKGYVAKIPCKVLIPLRRIKGANPSENSNKPNQKYIQIETTDAFEFWFMGFVCYQRSFKNLKQAISESQMSYLK